MKYGADPSLIDGEGCSCVHVAAQFGHTSIVAYLIAKGQVGKTDTAGHVDASFYSSRTGENNLKMDQMFIFTSANVLNSYGPQRYF